MPGKELYKPDLQKHASEVDSLPPFISAAAQQRCDRNLTPPENLIRRHFDGDWGGITPGDMTSNERALETGAGEVISRWFKDEDRVWVVSESKKQTRVIVPSEW